MESEDNSLLGCYFISKRPFWSTMGSGLHCNICADYRCLRVYQQWYFFVLNNGTVLAQCREHKKPVFREYIVQAKGKKRNPEAS